MSVILFRPVSLYSRAERPRRAILHGRGNQFQRQLEVPRYLWNAAYSAPLQLTPFCF
jgi:hypothetical protein